MGTVIKVYKSTFNLISGTEQEHECVCVVNFTRTVVTVIPVIIMLLLGFTQQLWKCYEIRVVQTREHRSCFAPSDDRLGEAPPACCPHTWDTHCRDSQPLISYYFYGISMGQDGHRLLHSAHMFRHKCNICQLPGNQAQLWSCQLDTFIAFLPGNHDRIPALWSDFHACSAQLCFNTLLQWSKQTSDKEKPQKSCESSL